MTPDNPAAVTEAHRSEARQLLADRGLHQFSTAVNALAQALADAERRGMERAAGIAAAHCPPKPKKSGFAAEELMLEIYAEQRGEKIAAEVIASAIRSTP